MNEYQLGDRVTMTGTVVKESGHWRSVRYKDSPVPGFVGYTWKDGPTVETRHPHPEGIVIGKRRYRSMENDEGIWVPDGVQDFEGYLVAWHMRRSPAIVRADQMHPASPPDTEYRNGADHE